jgi:multidrug efflux pump
MEQVSGPVIAVGLVLSAVFVPCAFISGLTGLFFRQFALTIAVSTLISTFNSLTLSPALCALLLRPRVKTTAPPLPRVAFLAGGAWLAWWALGDRCQALLPVGWPWWSGKAVAATGGGLAGWALGRGLNFVLAACFSGFNRGFKATTTGYTRGVGLLLRGGVLVLVVYVGLLGLTGHLMTTTPRGFIPSQDMGYLLVNVQLPDSASLERTEKVMRQIEDITADMPGVRRVTAISGQSFALNAYGSNFGSMFVNLKYYQDRRTAELHSNVIAQKLREAYAAQISDADVAVFGPPPMRGVGRAGGFAMIVEDRGDLGGRALQEASKRLVEQAAGQKGKLVGLFCVYRANVPQLEVVPDPGRCLLRGVRIQDFTDAISVYQGSRYVDDFNLYGRTWAVVVQADGDYRSREEDVYHIKVRNYRGEMVPIGSLAEVRPRHGPLVLTRYNMYPAATIQGGSGPGFSSREAIDLMEKLAKEELPPSMAVEWTDMAFFELQAGNTALVIFCFSVVMVFLVLAAQYESWSLPLAVILVVPMCLLSALIGVKIGKQDMNIFTQIGFVVLVGLASKNAILIVEFAKKRRADGMSRRQATLEACQLRLRPIVMTSMAFVLGVLPLMIAHGAGAEMRQALGTAVFSGMLGVTLFGVFLTPIFFATIDWLGETRAFDHGPLRRLGDGFLDLLTLGHVRRLLTRNGKKNGN